jgi:hypothetical protein
MAMDRMLADEQPFADRLIVQAVGDEFEHFDLASAQAGLRRARFFRRRRCNGVKRHEHRSGSRHFQFGVKLRPQVDGALGFVARRHGAP